MQNKKELLAFANRINNKFNDLHGLCYSDKSNNIFDQENDASSTKEIVFIYISLMN